MIINQSKFAPIQYQTLVNIFVSTSQVTFGVAFATLFLQPLDIPKMSAILISGIVSVILWTLAIVLSMSITQFVSYFPFIIAIGLAIFGLFIVFLPQSKRKSG